MMKIEAQLTRADLERLTGMFRLSEEACLRAARRAVRKTAKWTEGTAVRTLSSQLRIQQKILRQRLRLYAQGEGLEQKVWVGLNALAAKRLGAARRKGGGTQVGRHFFPGAFPIARYGSGVYRRTGRARFPLTLVKLEIDQAGAVALRQAAQRAEERLLHILGQELNYELSKTLRQR